MTWIDLRTADDSPMRAYVSRPRGAGPHPALLDRVPNLQAPHLFFWGGQDRGIPPEQHRMVADALRLAEKRFVDVEFSDAFFNEQVAERYNAHAARASWALSLSFLRDALSP